MELGELVLQIMCPITIKDRQTLGHALMIFNRHWDNPAYGEARRYIIRRARQIGAIDMLPNQGSGMIDNVVDETVMQNNPYHGFHGRFASGGGSTGKGAPKPKIAGLPEHEKLHEIGAMSAHDHLRTGHWRLEVTGTEESWRGTKYHVAVLPHLSEHHKELPQVSEGLYQGRTRWYDSQIAEPHFVDDGFMTRYEAKLKPGSGYTAESPFNDAPRVETPAGTSIYRGMSAEEFHSIMSEGKIGSRGDQNFTGLSMGKLDQANLTYFSASPRTAQSYAGGFAPQAFEPSFGHPGYVIHVKQPEGSVTDRPVGEVGVPNGILSKSDILDAWEMRAYQIEGGEFDLRPDDFGRVEGLHMGSGSPTKVRYAFRKLSPNELVVQFNPNHGYHGRFSSGSGETSLERRVRELGGKVPRTRSVKSAGRVKKVKTDGRDPLAERVQAFVDGSSTGHGAGAKRATRPRLRSKRGWKRASLLSGGILLGGAAMIEGGAAYYNLRKRQELMGHEHADLPHFTINGDHLEAPEHNPEKAMAELHGGMLFSAAQVRRPTGGINEERYDQIAADINRRSLEGTGQSSAEGVRGLHGTLALARERGIDVRLYSPKKVGEHTPASFFIPETNQVNLKIGSADDMFHLAVHETTHALRQQHVGSEAMQQEWKALDGYTREELIAEGTAYTVMRHYGIPSPTSAPYMGLFSSNNADEGGKWRDTTTPGVHDAIARHSQEIIASIERQPVLQAYNAAELRNQTGQWGVSTALRGLPGGAPAPTSSQVGHALPTGQQPAGGMQHPTVTGTPQPHPELGTVSAATKALHDNAVNAGTGKNKAPTVPKGTKTKSTKQPKVHIVHPKAPKKAKAQTKTKRAKAAARGVKGKAAVHARSKVAGVLKAGKHQGQGGRGLTPHHPPKQRPLRLQRAVGKIGSGGLSGVKKQRIK